MLVGVTDPVARLLDLGADVEALRARLEWASAGDVEELRAIADDMLTLNARIRALIDEA